MTTVSPFSVHLARHNPYSAGSGHAAQYLVFFAYVALSIFYVFQSGYPQPADFILVMGLVTAFLARITKPRVRILNQASLVLFFAFYALLINLIHYAFLPDIRFFLSSGYYVYNALIFLFIMGLVHQSPEFYKKILYYGVAVSVLLQGILAVINPIYEGVRLIGTFNNPNQITYWALISLTLLILIRYRSQLNYFDLGLIGILGYITLLALSKAGLIVYALLCAVILFTRMLTPLKRTVIGFGLVIMTIFMIFDSHSVINRVSDIQAFGDAIDRLEGIGGQADDSLEGRGYDRIISHPEYVILGAGEGGYTRFSGIGARGNELHSGLATLIFCYGILGTLFFGLFIYSVFRRLPLLCWVLLLGLMTYGLTHQNIRNSYFWVFLGTVYMVGYERKLDKQRQLEAFYITAQDEEPPPQPA